MYLALLRGRIHRVDSTFLSKTPLKKKEEEEEEGGSKGDVFGGESKDRHSAKHKLSQTLLSFFHFLQF